MSRMSSPSRTAEVTCPAGTVIGVRDGRCNYFRSVPYARVARPFDDPVAPQRGMLIDATLDAPATPALSITTPAGAQALADLPVVVWIHGGRFEEGSHTELVSNPAGVAAAGVVHVRVGYRLKFPGMLPVTADAPGHYRAAADCAAALTWIQRNIEAFGGDPTNVTVVGQSAGGALALWLTRRDHYRGEFRRALAISPAFPRRGFEARKWAARGTLGVPLTREALNELAERNPAKLDRAYQRFRARYPTDMALGPHPLDPTELAPVPTVVTYTDGEFYREGLAFRRTRQRISDASVRRPARAVAAGAPGPVWLAEHVRPGGSPLGHSEDLPALFAPDPWLLRFIRTGEVGWASFADGGHVERRSLGAEAGTA